MPERLELGKFTFKGAAEGQPVPPVMEFLEFAKRINIGDREWFVAKSAEGGIKYEVVEGVIGKDLTTGKARPPTPQEFIAGLEAFTADRNDRLHLEEVQVLYAKLGQPIIDDIDTGKEKKPQSLRSEMTAFEALIPDLARKAQEAAKTFKVTPEKEQPMQEGVFLQDYGMFVIIDGGSEYEAFISAQEDAQRGVYIGVKRKRTVGTRKADSDERAKVKGLLQKRLTETTAKDERSAIEHIISLMDGEAKLDLSQHEPVGVTSTEIFNRQLRPYSKLSIENKAGSRVKIEYIFHDETYSLPGDDRSSVNGFFIRENDRIRRANLGEMEYTVFLMDEAAKARRGVDTETLKGMADKARTLADEERDKTTVDIEGRIFRFPSNGRNLGFRMEAADGLNLFFSHEPYKPWGDTSTDEKKEVVLRMVSTLDQDSAAGEGGALLAPEKREILKAILAKSLETFPANELQQSFTEEELHALRRKASE